MGHRETSSLLEVFTLESYLIQTLMKVDDSKDSDLRFSARSPSNNLIKVELLNKAPKKLVLFRSFYSLYF